MHVHPSPSPRVRATLAASLCVALVPMSALAQSGSEAMALPTPARLTSVVVTATRTEARAFDIAASIDRIGGDEVRDAHARVNITESLSGVPGLLARDRQNYAQDVQISVRGFGARSTFGIRGVRLYVDGIPATLPDGQGQISNVELGSVGRIEVLRGPFSALYGNSAGGVIQVYTEEPEGPPRLEFGASAGSAGMLRLGAQATGAIGDFGYVASASRFATDGYRDHSETHRLLANAKLTLRPDPQSKLTFVANSLNLPQAQDPLGLSRAQFEANPRGVDPSALSFDTRKTVDQTQGGLIYERRVDAANMLTLTGYLGHRDTEQFQSIPVSTQANPLNPGGVISLGRDYRGVDLRWTLRGSLLDTPLTVVGGVAYDALSEKRRGYQNFIGTTLGVEGALRRNETNDVSNVDGYVQALWQIAPRWSVNAGVRHSRVRFASTDQYVVGTNPDDSGSASYGATLPVLGAMYALSDDVHLYATAGRGFETPTLNELAYRSSGATGLNFDLQAAKSTSVELGAKTRFAAIGELNLAVFETHTDREIVTQTNVGGRATYQNAGATRRTGLELGWSDIYADHLRAQLAYTTLSATYRDAFSTCTAAPCATPNLLVASGNSLPGVAHASLFAALGWMPPLGWRGGVEVRALGRVYVNDVNTDAASGYAVAAAHTGYVLKAGPWLLNGFVRVDNLFDRGYAGSVIVNEGNGRYFEPAPGRTWLASVSATLTF